MNTLPLNRLAVFSAVLVLPALFLIMCGVLYLAFDLKALNDWLGAFIATPAGKILMSPVLILGGLLVSLALNLWATCRVRVGLDTGTVYVTFWIARAPGRLFLTGIAMLLTTLLLAYGFVENFMVVPR